MEKSEWEEVVKNAPEQNLSGIVWRIVESQQDIATLSLVDTLEEQALLEEMLDESKPPVPDEAEKLHYLLSTPFRYPPLEWGSRFGSEGEASLYYGSMEQKTAFAEFAFYRLVFRSGVDGGFPNQTVSTNHTLFMAEYDFDPGIDLTVEPFSEYADVLKHKSNYQPTKNLGSVLRDAGFAGFYFPSARCPKEGTNIAIYVPTGLRSTSPKEQHQCYCETTDEQVTIKLGHSLYEFPLKIFEVDGQLPGLA